MNRLLVLDPETCEEMIRERKRLGHDRYDEVWEAVYVMPSMPHLIHQRIVGGLTKVFGLVVEDEKRGQVYPGANVSDQPVNWKDNYRVPDVVVVLNKSHAEYGGVFLYGGPSFLVEIESAEEDVSAKLPFYSRIQVEELLIVERDTRKLRLLRHNGKELADIETAAFQGAKWLLSKVLPLAFRRKSAKGDAKIEIARTGGPDGRWFV